MRLWRFRGWESSPDWLKGIFDLYEIEALSGPVSHMLPFPDRLCVFQAALRRLAAGCPDSIEAADQQQLIKPRLVDSFLLCSNMEESFVWRGPSNHPPSRCRSLTYSMKMTIQEDTCLLNSTRNSSVTSQDVNFWDKRRRTFFTKEFFTTKCFAVLF